MIRAFADVDELFGALEASRDADDEGGVSILDHSLQCAELLRVARPDDLGLQVAGLVHDLGWLERVPPGWALRLDAAHDIEGRELLGGLLGERVARLVGGHVAAKRYLLATDAGYAQLLSDRSTTTLGFQGGVMSPAEADEFARSPDLDDLLVLRRNDDEAKVRGARVPGLTTWRAAVEAVAHP
jgi:predicted HD phosphohydrolase